MPVLHKKPKPMRVMDAELDLSGKKRKRSRSLTSIPLQKGRRGERALRGMQGALEKKERVSRLRGMMFILPIVMVLVFAGGLWIAIQEFQKLNPPAPQLASSSELPLPEAGAASEVLALNDRLLTLVSQSNPLDESFALDLTQVEEITCDATAAPYLERLLQDARNEGHNLQVVRGYVDNAQQQQLYDQKVQELMAQGYTKVRAEVEAEKVVPLPGESENQTGLAVDFSLADLGEQTLDQTPAGQWLIRNCVEYGFILRYPNGEEKTTGMAYDPAHFRFVGVENAKKMRTLDMTLEEYAPYMEAQRQASAE
ncbi:MAG TPA: M15 family metallopeptidase [Candidatus Gallacutalibacter stercoravium]|nr:M15 family metallopeptidase [Candidatus Gallacutalibacter stercoravium]